MQPIICHLSVFNLPDNPPMSQKVHFNGGAFRAGSSRRWWGGLVLAAVLSVLLNFWALHWFAAAMGDATWQHLQAPTQVALLRVSDPPPQALAVKRRAVPKTMNSQAVQTAADRSDAKDTDNADPSGASEAGGKTGKPAAQASPWPPTTLLKFALSGNYRGPLHGSGEMNWIRLKDEYEASLKGSALFSFEYRSRGKLTGEHIWPDRFEEQTFNATRWVNFNREAGTLSLSHNPEVVPIPNDVHDSATMFMAMAQMLSQNPEIFVRGGQFSLQVARPNRLVTWEFEVLGLEPISTVMGELLSWHVQRVAKNGDQEMRVDLWLSQQLKNLPIQLRLQTNAQTFVLLTLTQAEQAKEP